MSLVEAFVVVLAVPFALLGGMCSTIVVLTFVPSVGWIKEKIGRDVLQKSPLYASAEGESSGNLTPHISKVDECAKLEACKDASIFRMLGLQDGLPMTVQIADEW